MDKWNKKIPKRKKSHAYTEWAKSRLDEMDATIFTLEDKVKNLETNVSAKASKALSELHIAFEKANKQA